jgi:hypothetical protein
LGIGISWLCDGDPQGATPVEMAAKVTRYLTEYATLT